MKTLDLIDLDKSDIKYQPINYPDGQKDIFIIPYVITDHKIQISFGVMGIIPEDKSVQIKSRLNNAEDLLMIVCATKALRNLKVKEIHLYVPYIIGLRSDRLFQEGGNRYVKDIIAPILNMQNYESVICYDAHSSVAENCINNLVNISNVQLVQFAINDIYNLHYIKKGDKEVYLDNTILISPDAGASHKIYKLAEQISYKGDIITCNKERDKNGKLTQVNVPLHVDKHKFGSDFIIIDDICDGGATFINIAKWIKNSSYADSKIYLIVTHGIFSKGFNELSKYFDGIYCTNSYIDLKDVESFDTTDMVKQLNIF